MSRFPLFVVLLGLSFLIAPAIEAQSPEMPEPLAMVVDADGKPMLQVVGIDNDDIRVLFEFEGESAIFTLYDDHSDFDAYGRHVFFSLDN